MKLCWEHLNHLILMPGLRASNQPRLVYYKDVENVEGSLGEHDISEWLCENCNNYFLIHKDSTTKFCDKECRTEYYKKKKEKEKREKRPDKRYKENGGGWHMKGNTWASWNAGLRYGVINENTGYDNFKEQLEWFTEVRPDPETGQILQVKCCICGKWHAPKRERVRNIINYVNKGTKNSWGFYCSKDCEDKCPHFGKSYKTIMKEDYLNSGNAKYSDLHYTPPTVLYYDWQEELRKINKTLLKLKIKEEKRKKARAQALLKKAEASHRAKELKKKWKVIQKEKEQNTRAYRKKTRLKRILYLTKHRAKTKGWDHDIDFEWLAANVGTRCPKSGIKYNYNMDIKMNPYAPSLDRIDSDKGYTKDNCIVVSWFYNCGKNAFDDDVLYNICKAYLDNQP